MLLFLPFSCQIPKTLVSSFHRRSVDDFPDFLCFFFLFFLHLHLVDIPTFEAHVARVAAAGVGPLIAGSMGEASHLSHAERVRLIHAGRKALDTAGFPNVPIIVGTGSGSTRETVELSQEAADAGADYAIVITSGYFAGALAGNKEALKAFFREVSAKSPIPVMIYNCESASSSTSLHVDALDRPRSIRWH